MDYNNYTVYLLGLQQPYCLFTWITTTILFVYLDYNNHTVYLLGLQQPYCLFTWITTTNTVYLLGLQQPYCLFTWITTTILFIYLDYNNNILFIYLDYNNHTVYLLGLQQPYNSRESSVSNIEQLRVGDVTMTSYISSIIISII